MSWRSRRERCSGSSLRVVYKESLILTRLTWWCRSKLQWDRVMLTRTETWEVLECRCTICRLKTHLSTCWLRIRRRTLTRRPSRTKFTTSSRGSTSTDRRLIKVEVFLSKAKTTRLVTISVRARMLITQLSVPMDFRFHRVIWPISNLRTQSLPSFKAACLLIKTRDPKTKERLAEWLTRGFSSTTRPRTQPSKLSSRNSFWSTEAARLSELQNKAKRLMTSRCRHHQSLLSTSCHLRAQPTTLWTSKSERRQENKTEWKCQIINI